LAIRPRYTSYECGTVSDLYKLTSLWRWRGNKIWVGHNRVDWPSRDTIFSWKYWWYHLRMNLHHGLNVIDSQRICCPLTTFAGTSKTPFKSTFKYTKLSNRIMLESDWNVTSMASKTDDFELSSHSIIEFTGEFVLN